MNTKPETQNPTGFKPVPPDPARGPHIFDFKGRAIHILDPRPEDVHPEVIAHSLALQCRYGGHCPRFLSVAEHSLLVAEVVAREHPELAHTKIVLAALLHDAPEAIVGDIVSPLKRRVLIDQRPYGSTMPIAACPPRHIETLEEKWLDAIMRRFGVECPEEAWGLWPGHYDTIHRADLAVGAAEMLSFGWDVASCPRVGHLAPAEGLTIRHLSPEQAEEEFLVTLAECLGFDCRFARGFPKATLERIEQLLAQRAEASSAPPAGEVSRG